MAKIRDYLVNYDLYKVDYDYQRPADAWSREDKQCLIDTILKITIYAFILLKIMTMKKSECYFPDYSVENLFQ